MKAEVKKALHAPHGRTGWELWVNGRLRGHYQSHRAAWRDADKIMGEARSRAEAVTEWINQKERNEGWMKPLLCASISAKRHCGKP